MTMRTDDSTLKMILLAIALLLAVLVLRLFFDPAATVSAQSARFDHVMIASTGFLYKGQQGMLVRDKRNGKRMVLSEAERSVSGSGFCYAAAVRENRPGSSMRRCRIGRQSHPSA
jgi:hypothetical protein